MLILVAAQKLKYYNMGGGGGGKGHFLFIHFPTREYLKMKNQLQEYPYQFLSLNLKVYSFVLGRLL